MQCLPSPCLNHVAFRSRCCPNFSSTQSPTCSHGHLPHLQVPRSGARQWSMRGVQCGYWLAGASAQLALAPSCRPPLDIAFNRCLGGAIHGGRGTTFALFGPTGKPTWAWPKPQPQPRQPQGQRQRQGHGPSPQAGQGQRRGQQGEASGPCGRGCCCSSRSGSARHAPLTDRPQLVRGGHSSFCRLGHGPSHNFTRDCSCREKMSAVVSCQGSVGDSCATSGRATCSYAAQPTHTEAGALAKQLTRAPHTTGPSRRGPDEPRRTVTGPCRRCMTSTCCRGSEPLRTRKRFQRQYAFRVPARQPARSSRVPRGRRGTDAGG